jgi:hypothetical protein
MIQRILPQVAFSEEFGRQMRFITGPRQTGKTTIARSFLDTRNCGGLYYCWDLRSVRDRYLRDSHFFAQDIYNVASTEQKRWVCMDEIHKYPKWKNVLKDFFDSFGEQLGFIVTGSARLDMFRRSGDSLAGRYFLFHLGPLMLREAICEGTMPEEPQDGNRFVEDRLAKIAYHEDALEHLLSCGGFPEPFQSSSPRFRTKWRADYLDRILTQDLRNLTRIQDNENVSILWQLLPERIGSPLSINSLAQDLKIGFATAKGYIRACELVYLLFRVSPYSRKIVRSLTKESKAYLYDWTNIRDPGPRFENFIAVELKSLADLWTDAGIGAFGLSFGRTRDGKECDFLVVRDGRPWLLADAKLSRSTIDPHHLKVREILGDTVPFVQIVREDGIAEMRSPGVYQMSASRFLA